MAFNVRMAATLAITYQLFNKDITNIKSAPQN